MIYLFNREKVAVKAIDYDDFNTLIQIEIVNGNITLSSEIRLLKVLKGDKKPTNIKKLFDDIEFIGHFDYKEDFQMYRLIKPSVSNSTLGYYSVHIFHDEGQAKAVIHDRRWRDSQAHTVLKDAYAYIGWELTDYDSSKVLHHNAFRQTPAQVRAEVIEKYGVEIEPYLEFDGKRITRKCFRVKQRIGIETHDRFDYGSDLLDITHEEDKGDIYTAVIPRGNGEEGIANSKIEIDTIAWSKANGDPVDKPLGQNWLEVPTATQQYGYVEDGAVSPRTIVMDFETDDVPELAQLAWEWINENCVPKSLMETVVHTVGRNYGLGDSIGIVYKEADIIKKARIQKAERNLKRPILTKFQIGDYDYFIKNTITRQYRKKLNDVEQSTNKSVEVLNDRFNTKYDEAVQRIDNSANAVKDYADAQIIAKEQEYKENWDIRDKALNDSIEKLAGGSLDGIQTNVTELYTDMLKKLEQADLQPLESRLEASEKGIKGVFTNLGQLSGARNILSSENVSYIEAAKVFMAGDYITSGEYVFSVHNPLYHNTKIDFTVYSMVEGKIIYHIDTTLTDMSTPFRFSIEDSVKEPMFLFSISNFTMADFEKAKIQLERGTEMTEWSPALVDIDTNVAEMSSRLTFNEEKLNTTFTKIDNLKIGTKNIVRNSNFEHGWDYWDNYGGGGVMDPEAYRVISLYNGKKRLRLVNKTSEGWFGVRQTLPDVQISEEYTVSMYVNSNAGNGQISIALTGSPDMIFDITPKLRRISFTHIAPVGAQYLFIRTPKGVPVDILAQDIQVERSSIVSDYAPSPKDMDDKVTKLIGELDLTAEKLETTFAKVNDNAGDISTMKQTASNISQSVSSMSGKVDSLEGWRADKGTLFEQTADKVQQSVWQQDIDAIEMGTENLIPNSDFLNWPSTVVPDEWRTKWGAGEVFSGRQNGKHLLVRANYETVNTSTTYGVQSPILTRDVIAGEEYTLVFNNFDYGNFPYDYMYLMNVDGSSNQSLGTPVHDGFVYKWLDSYTSKNVERLVLKVVPTFSGRARIMFAKRIDPGQKTSFYISEPMFVKGNTAPKSYSPSPADSLRHTDFILRSDGFLLGGNYVGGSHYSTAIVGDPGGLKLLGDNIDVHGNLNVKGDVEAWSVSAVTANVGSVFANTGEFGFIKGKHVEFDSAFITDFVTKSAFIDNAQIKAANIRDLETISLTSEQVKVGFNKVGSNIQITNTGLETTSGGTVTSRLYSAGHEFFRAGNRVGKIGTAAWYGHPTHRGLSFQLDSSADYFSFGLEEDIEDVYSAKLMWHKNSNATAKGFTMNDDVGIANDLTVKGTGGIYANRDINGLNVEARTALKAGSRAKVQSSGNGARLYASDNVWLYVNDNGQVGISVNGKAHAIITV